MDIPGPTTQVGTKTDYSVGSWDYSTCATPVGVGCKDYKGIVLG
jgi:hypothetical protein